MAKSMRSVARHRQETGLLDVKMTSYERLYHPRFNQRRSCTTASALQPPRKESAKSYSEGRMEAFMRKPQIPFGDRNRIRAGAAPPVCGLREDESQALLGCATTLQAHHRSEGHSCAAYLGLHDGIFAGDGVNRCMCLADPVQGEGTAAYLDRSEGVADDAL